jgi:hypothetical protein
MMTGMTGRNQFEESEYWVYMQQRFEAALKFATSDVQLLSDGSYCKPSFQTAINMADDLIAQLEESRTKTNEETAF